MGFDLVTKLHLDGTRRRRSTATASPRDGPAGSGRGFGAERNPARVVFFSDAVFTITVTLLVLEIRPPTDYMNLLHGLAVLWPSYLAYALTFLFIGQVWANHHGMFDHIRAADRVILLLSTLLLMIVAFLPFATAFLAGALRSGHGLRIAVVFYGIAFDATALTFTAVWQYARGTGCSARPLTRRAQGPSAGDSAGPGLAHDRRPAQPPDTGPGRNRDRCTQRLLLAPDPGESPRRRS